MTESVNVEKTCRGCKAELDADAVFCNECGMVQVEAETSDKTCPQCQKRLEQHVKFCSVCAYDFSPPENSAPVGTNCPGCQKSYEANDKFCRHCAFDLRQAQKVSGAHFCVGCGKPFEVSDKFCRHCAADLSKSNQTIVVPTVSASSNISPSFNAPNAAPIQSSPSLSLPTVALSSGEIKNGDSSPAATAVKSSGLQWISPSAAAFALICFFMPWVEVSCSAFGSKLSGKTASGADLAQFDGSLWLLPLLAIGILGIFFIFKSQGNVSKARPAIAIAAILALAFMLFKAANLDSSLRGSLTVGSEWRTGLDVEPRFGVAGIILGFFVALLGVLFLGSRRVATVSNISLTQEFSDTTRTLKQSTAAALCYAPFAAYLAISIPRALFGGSLGNIFSIFGLLVYLCPIIFLLKEPYKNNQLIRFNAFQYLLMFGSIVAGYIIALLFLVVMPSVAAVFFLLIFLAYLVFLVTSIFCMYKVYHYQTVKLPLIGDWAINLAQNGLIR